MPYQGGEFKLWGYIYKEVSDPRRESLFLDEITSAETISSRYSAPVGDIRCPTILGKITGWHCEDRLRCILPQVLS